MIDSNYLMNVMKRYQDTQPRGVKDVGAQIELFSPDCVFVSFPVASVVGSVEPRLLHGRAALRDAFVAYNDFIMKQPFVGITYVDTYADVSQDGRSGICGFTLVIDTGDERMQSMAINQAQFHVRTDGLIYRMMNWQASSTPSIRDAVLGTDEAT